MPWKECSVMDERMQFVARRRGDGGTLQAYLEFEAADSSCAFTACHFPSR